MSTDNEWNASLNGDFLWSNANFGEAVTETMTPLTWSVIQFTLADWQFLPGYQQSARSRRGQRRENFDATGRPQL